MLIINVSAQKMKERMSALKNRRNELNFLKKGDAVTDCMNNICEVFHNNVEELFVFECLIIFIIFRVSSAALIQTRIYNK